METMLKVARLLPWFDWAAIAVWLAGWVGYVRFAKVAATSRPSILASTNRIRRLWMMQTTYRDVRVVDGVVIQNLSTSPSFFASTTILIIGGLLAVLGTTEKASELVREIPFAARTSVLVFDLKVVVLLIVFVHAFFLFTWSMRQYTFGALLIASAPEPRQFIEAGPDGQQQREAFARRAGQVVSLAAETFNDGLRAYYFSFATVGWFVSPLIFMLATAAVITVLYRREFGSEMLAVLND